MFPYQFKVKARVKRIDTLFYIVQRIWSRKRPMKKIHSCRSGDFLWTQRWHGSSDESNGQILCHNFPYDIYSVKGSCGPKADVCLQFNFAAKAVQQPYNEYAMATRPITPANVKERYVSVCTDFLMWISLMLTSRVFCLSFLLEFSQNPGVFKKNI